MIKGRRMQAERREGYEKQLVTFGDGVGLSMRWSHVSIEKLVSHVSVALCYCISEGKQPQNATFCYWSYFQLLN